MILDVGCGDSKIKGAIGVDWVKLPGVDKVHDLNIFPWPFKDESFNKIYMMNIIEHLPNTIKVMEELYRLLVPGGIVHIEVVYWNHRHSVSDPQHVSFFNEVVWDFFIGKRKGYYTKAKYKMNSIRYIYDRLATKIFISKHLMN